MISYTFHVIHELGQRSNQEDSVFPEKGSVDANGIFIVCDGMGGHNAGEVASSAVCDTLSTCPELPFEDALDLAYGALDSKDDGSLRKMGTTLAYLRIAEDHAFVAHIGDSRVYQIRPSEKRIVFVTHDHSLVNALVEAGEITPEEARTHPQKNVITRAMQPNCERVPAEIHILEDVRPGDWFFVCSDGMLESMDDASIVNVISMHASDERKLGIFKSVTSNARDNHTAIMIRTHSEKKGIRGFIHKSWPFIK